LHASSFARHWAARAHKSQGLSSNANSSRGVGMDRDHAPQSLATEWQAETLSPGSARGGLESQHQDDGKDDDVTQEPPVNPCRNDGHHRQDGEGYKPCFGFAHGAGFYSRIARRGKSDRLGSPVAGAIPARSVGMGRHSTAQTPPPGGRPWPHWTVPTRTPYRRPIGVGTLWCNPWCKSCQNPTNHGRCYTWQKPMFMRFSYGLHTAKVP
jgi:hypothetical protein